MAGKDLFSQFLSLQRLVLKLLSDTDKIQKTQSSLESSLESYSQVLSSLNQKYIELQKYILQKTDELSSHFVTTDSEPLNQTIQGIKKFLNQLVIPTVLPEDTSQSGTLYLSSDKVLKFINQDLIEDEIISRLRDQEISGLKIFSGSLQVPDKELPDTSSHRELYVHSTKKTLQIGTKEVIDNRANQEIFGLKEFKDRLGLPSHLPLEYFSFPPLNGEVVFDSEAQELKIRRNDKWSSLNEYSKYDFIVERPEHYKAFTVNLLKELRDKFSKGLLPLPDDEDIHKWGLKPATDSATNPASLIGLNNDDVEYRDNVRFYDFEQMRWVEGSCWVNKNTGNPVYIKDDDYIEFKYFTDTEGNKVLSWDTLTEGNYTARDFYAYDSFYLRNSKSINSGKLKENIENATGQTLSGIIPQGVIYLGTDENGDKYLVLANYFASVGSSADLYIYAGIMYIYEDFSISLVSDFVSSPVVLNYPTVFNSRFSIVQKIKEDEYLIVVSRLYGDTTQNIHKLVRVNISDPTNIQFFVSEGISGQVDNTYVYHYSDGVVERTVVGFVSDPTSKGKLKYSVYDWNNNSWSDLITNLTHYYYRDYMLSPSDKARVNLPLDEEKIFLYDYQEHGKYGKIGGIFGNGNKVAVVYSGGDNINAIRLITDLDSSPVVSSQYIPINNKVEYSFPVILMAEGSDTYIALIYSSTGLGTSGIKILKWDGSSWSEEASYDTVHFSSVPNAGVVVDTNKFLLWNTITGEIWVLDYSNFNPLSISPPNKFKYIPFYSFPFYNFSVYENLGKGQIDIHSIPSSSVHRRDIVKEILYGQIKFDFDNLANNPPKKWRSFPSLPRNPYTGEKIKRVFVKDVNSPVFKDISYNGTERVFDEALNNEQNKVLFFNEEQGLLEGLLDLGIYDTSDVLIDYSSTPSLYELKYDFVGESGYEIFLNGNVTDKIEKGDLIFNLLDVLYDLGLLKKKEDWFSLSQNERKELLLNNWNKISKKIPEYTYMVDFSHRITSPDMTQIIFYDKSMTYFTDWKTSPRNYVFVIIKKAKGISYYSTNNYTSFVVGDFDKVRYDVSRYSYFESPVFRLPERVFSRKFMICNYKSNSRSPVPFKLYTLLVDEELIQEGYLSQLHRGYYIDAIKNQFALSKPKIVNSSVLPYLEIDTYDKEGDFQSTNHLGLVYKSLSYKSNPIQINTTFQGISGKLFIQHPEKSSVIEILSSPMLLGTEIDFGAGSIRFYKNFSLISGLVINKIVEEEAKVEASNNYCMYNPVEIGSIVRSKVEIKVEYNKGNNEVSPLFINNIFGSEFDIYSIFNKAQKYGLLLGFVLNSKGKLTGIGNTSYSFSTHFIHVIFESDLQINLKKNFVYDRIVDRPYYIFEEPLSYNSNYFVTSTNGIIIEEGQRNNLVLNISHNKHPNIYWDGSSWQNSNLSKVYAGGISARLFESHIRGNIDHNYGGVPSELYGVGGGILYVNSSIVDLVTVYNVCLAQNGNAGDSQIIIHDAFYGLSGRYTHKTVRVIGWGSGIPIGARAGSFCGSASSNQYGKVLLITALFGKNYIKNATATILKVSGVTITINNAIVNTYG